MFWISPLEELQRLSPQFKKNVIPSDFKAYSLVLPTEKMYAFTDKNDTIINYDKNRYFKHRVNTDGYLDGSISSVSGNTANVYYQVKSSDNLSSITRKNGTTVARLQSWDGLTSTKLSIGKQLIVGQKNLPAPKSESEKNEYARTETAGGGNIISSYLKNQIEKVEQNKLPDEPESVSGVEIELPESEGSWRNKVVQGMVISLILFSQ